MGILKSLTDEYFDKIARTEDGHVINIRGIELVVPNSITDEEDFIKSISSKFDVNYRVIFDSEKVIDDETVIRRYHRDGPLFGGDYRFSVFFPKPSKDDLTEGFDIWKKAVIKFLKYIMEDVDAFTFGNNTTEAYCLIGTKTFLIKELEKVYTNKTTINRKITSLVDGIRWYVEKNVQYSDTDRICVEMNWNGDCKDFITSHIISWGQFSIKRVIGYIEMKKIWNEEMEKIKTEGVKKYFNKKK